MHDPDRGPQIRKAGVAARAGRVPAVLTAEQAADLIRLTTPDDRQRTLEQAARMRATGELDPKVADSIFQAVNGAQRDHEAARAAREWGCTFCGVSHDFAQLVVWQHARICGSCIDVCTARFRELSLPPPTA